jgi:hypothetical protein
VTQRPVRSPLECGRVRCRPRSQGSRCSTRMAASSEPRSALAKPTSSSARSRSPARSAAIGARIWRRMWAQPLQRTAPSRCRRWRRVSCLAAGRHRRSPPSCAGMSRKTQSLALTFFVTCRANVCRHILTHGRGALMTTYRFVWRDNKGNAPKSAQIECLTDQQAIDIAAHQTGDYETVEVWDGGRPVCRCGNSDKTGRADGRSAVRDSLASIA